jgi:hypothetical protein
MHRRISTSTPWNITIVVLIVLLGTLYFLLAYNSVFFAPDEGATVYHFEKSAEGAVQHRDFYSVYGGGYYLLGKNLFRLFGFRIIVLRVFVLVLKLAMAVLIYFIALTFMRSGFAFLSSLGFIIWWGDPSVPTPTFLYPGHISQALGLLSILFLCAYQRRPRRLFLAFAGLAIGLSCLFKPTMGVLALMALFLFFFSREMLFDMTRTPPESARGKPRSPAWLGKAGILLELVGTAGAATILFLLAAKPGFDFPTFLFFLLPIYLVFAYVLIQALRVLRAPDKGSLVWNNHKETIIACLFLGGGFLFWQGVQIAYFMSESALGDFLNMFATAADYYHGSARQLWEGARVMAMCGGVLLIGLLCYATLCSTAGFGTRKKIVIALVGVCGALMVPASWHFRMNNVYGHHFTIWVASISVSLAASLFVAYRDSLRGVGEESMPGFLSHLLVTIYASANLLDAFTIVDTGHLAQILPPFLILLGYLGERCYDSWKDYLKNALPRVGSTAAGTVTGILMLGILLPSLYMMFMFKFITVPTPDRRWRLPQGKLTLVPRSPVTLERARGISIHTLDGHIWIPPECPRTKHFFDVARRISETTRQGDRIFATMGSSLMLCFLSDRDSLSGAESCYVWQTVMGMTTSDALKNFSDIDLTRLIEEKMPAAIIMEDPDKTHAVETERFIANFPHAWKFIVTHYRLSEDIGPFKIYVPED